MALCYFEETAPSLANNQCRCTKTQANLNHFGVTFSFNWPWPPHRGCVASKTAANYSFSICFFSSEVKIANRLVVLFSCAHCQQSSISPSLISSPSLALCKHFCFLYNNCSSSGSVHGTRTHTVIICTALRKHLFVQFASWSGFLIYGLFDWRLCFSTATAMVSATTTTITTVAFVGDIACGYCAKATPLTYPNSALVDIRYSKHTSLACSRFLGVGFLVLCLVIAPSLLLPFYYYYYWGLCQQQGPQ